MFQKLFKMYCKIIHYSSPRYATPTIAGKKKKFLKFEDWIFLIFFFPVGSIKRKQSLAFQLRVCQSASESHKHKKISPSHSSAGNFHPCLLYRGSLSPKVL